MSQYIMLASPAFELGFLTQSPTALPNLNHLPSQIHPKPKKKWWITSLQLVRLA